MNKGGLCRMIKPSLLHFQSEWNRQIKIVGVNADENFKLANAYRLTNLPTLILFDQGQVVHRIEGLQGREELCRTLEKAVVNLIPNLAWLPKFLGFLFPPNLLRLNNCHVFSRAQIRSGFSNLGEKKQQDILIYD